MAEKDQDLKIILEPEAQASVDGDPELAKAMKEFLAMLHQAAAGIRAGQYRTLDEGMEAISGGKVTMINGPSIDAETLDAMGIESVQPQGIAIMDVWDATPEKDEDDAE